MAVTPPRLVLAGVALAAVLLAGIFARGGDDGRAAAAPVAFMGRTSPATDRFTDAPGPRQRTLLRRRFARLTVYPPYFDARTRWYPRGLANQNLYAIYPRRDGSPAHPGWVLRSAARRRLWIPWGCARGRCPQYAGDVLDAAFRRAWIARARAVLARGYRGLWIDDVNLEPRVSDARERSVTPVDRRGRPVTPARWRAAVASFVAEVRAAFPRAEIAHNAIWWAGRRPGLAPGQDPDVRRAIRAADWISLERGCSDAGLTGGSGAWSLAALLGFVDEVHTAGRSVIWQPYDAHRPAVRETNLACLLLTRARRDALESSELDPADRWPGWALDPGAPTGPRVRGGALWTRRFGRALAVVADPGGPARFSPPSGRWDTLAGRPLRGALTLRGGTGRVLLADAG